jgi:hypothetical protein
MDQARPERCENPTRPYTFKVTLNSTGREFFFGAQNEEEVTAWVQALEKAQQW